MNASYERLRMHASTSARKWSPLCLPVIVAIAVASIAQGCSSNNQRISGETRSRIGVQGSSFKPTGNGGRIVWVASSHCLNRKLFKVLTVVAANYGWVQVNSTCRSWFHNWRVGGARHSYHLTGNAADIRIYGNWRGAQSYLKNSVGGYKSYGGGRFHIDTGPRRRF